jgi:hypothetical protein
MRCVDALFQLEVLAGDWKVYKPGPGNDRTYLNDRDRPAEMVRLSGERDANCSDEPGVLAAHPPHVTEFTSQCETATHASVRETSSRSGPDTAMTRPPHNVTG